MEKQKLVLQDGTYEYDDRTRQVSVSEDELKKAGYVKLADDERMVKKVELSEEEAQFMDRHQYLLFDDFSNSVSAYVKPNAEPFEEYKVTAQLTKAYFNGYTVKKEPLYYIKFGDWVTDWGNYLNVGQKKGEWFIASKTGNEQFKTRFTQSEIDELQKDEQAKGLDLNTLKVKVPDDELEE